MTDDLRRPKSVEIEEQEFDCEENVQYEGRLAQNSWNRRLIRSMSSNLFSKKICSCNKYFIAASGVIFVISVVFLSVSVMKHKTKHHQIGYCLKSQCVQTAARMISLMNPTIHPCNDFYKFACGKWISTHRIPEGKSSISNILLLKNKLDTNIETLLRSQSHSSDNEAINKAKSFYQTCLANQNHSAVMIQIRNVLADLGGWPMFDKNWDDTNKSWETLIAIVRKYYGQSVIFDSWRDQRDNNNIQIELLGSEISSYDFDSIVKYYRHQYELLVNIAALFGAEMGHVKRKATNLLRFQMQFSRIVNATGRVRGTMKDSQNMTMEQAMTDLSDINWLAYLKRLGYKNQAMNIILLNFREMEYFSSLIHSTDISTVYDYVIWKVVEQLLPFLSEPFIDLASKFSISKILGRHEKEKWRRCIEITNSKMGLAVAALFAKNNFFKDDTNKVNAIAENIRESFEDVISGSDWLDKSSRLKAKEEISKVNFKIGYPELINNDQDVVEIYSSISFEFGNIVQNLIEIRKFEYPDEKQRWSSTMSPINVNAIFDKDHNEIIFPAAMMQPPFFSSSSPESVNYGGIGVIIGHELIHTFDDQILGAANNSKLKKVFTLDGIRIFRKRLQCVDETYEAFSLEEEHRQNAKIENLADLSGVKIAYKALRKWRLKNRNEKILPGLKLNHDQLFFLNYAQVWCEATKQENGMATDVKSHSPKDLRVLGPLLNLDDFSKVYGCTMGQKMNPEVKCSVW